MTFTHGFPPDSRIAKFISDKLKQYGDEFKPDALAYKFAVHFNAGQSRRVKVKFPSGETVWGYVGVTTGWIPAFLLMRRRGQHGSSIVLSDEDEIIGQKDLTFY